jgi:hypothetical protein
MSEAEEKIFITIEDVFDYLSPNWKIAKSTLYRLINKDKKLVPHTDGTFLQKKVDKFAEDWLKEKSTGRKVSTEFDRLQRRKLEKELQTLELEYDRKKLSLEKEQGKYIPREQMDNELAARAGILEAGLKHWIQSRAAEWIRTVDGDTKKVGELINLLNRDIDEHINNYASTKEFQVIIDSAEIEEEATI